MIYSLTSNYKAILKGLSLVLLLISSNVSYAWILNDTTSADICSESENGEFTTGIQQVSELKTTLIKIAIPVRYFGDSLSVQKREITDNSCLAHIETKDMSYENRSQATKVNRIGVLRCEMNDLSEIKKVVGNKILAIKLQQSHPLETSNDSKDSDIQIKWKDTSNNSITTLGKITKVEKNESKNKLIVLANLTSSDKSCGHFRACILEEIPSVVELTLAVTHTTPTFSCNH
ncbi:MAG: hypothetical protein KDD40_04350 [Bdellovibrionales bacterium]|nr:hypothetical protein [Bdellovibrionales bacterium]